MTRRRFKLHLVQGLPGLAGSLLELVVSRLELLHTLQVRARPENFYVGTVNGKTACAFILQWSDWEYWPQAPEYEAGYLHFL